MNDNIKNGLNDKEVAENIKKYGTNKITSKKKDSFLKLFLESLGDPIIKILIIALGIKIIFLIKSFDWYETIGIVISIFIASFISSISEYGSEKAFEKLQEEASKIKCRVKRNNKIIEICIDDITVNDIIVLQAGDKIPADGIIIDGNITVNESILNGEAKESNKKSINNIYENPNKNNLVYRGTIVCDNEALMLVTKVGDNTLYGKIASELQEKQPKSPLKTKLTELAKIISKIGYIGAILVSISYLFSVIFIKNNFNLQLIQSTITNIPMMIGHILYALTLSVTIIVVAVPEGLPMMITLVLSANMNKMLKNNVLVRKMVGIETAGSINILFTDKTGTITKGKLEVVGLISANNKTYTDIKEIEKFSKFSELIKSNLFYNNACSINNNTISGGNITDKALMEFIHNYSIPRVTIISKEAFNSTKKMSSVTIDNGNKITLIKGAAEVLINKCNSYLDEDGIVKPFTKKTKIMENIDKITNNGIRVLTLAYENTKNHLYSEKLTFLCFILIKDDIRPEAIEGINLIKSAHINTIMITGDNKNTAMSIGREIGLLNNPEDIVLTSDELNSKTDENIKRIIPNLKIVARSSPTDKSKLIRLSQELGLVVGMTGDGVNDAPALKKADVGFAMGSGTEIAKEASDIVILDDNLLSISKAILFGRTIFKSIRKFIIFQLTVNLCAVSLSIIGPFIGIDTPVTVIQMLWINMVMDTFAGIAFSFEPPLIEYMNEYPKKRNESIINKYMTHQILFTGAYSSLICIIFLKSKFIKDLFRFDDNNLYLMTAFFGLFIFISIFNSFNTRTHRLNLFANITKNKIFLFIISFIILVQIFLLYHGGKIFRTAGLTFIEFQIMILIAFTVIPVDFIRKKFLRFKGIIGGV